jgi:WhiB family transcriptional regulator, redox-sensing transcriptional regulator
MSGDDWRDKAACAGQPTELFFPGTGQGKSTGEAKGICRHCPVVEPCLDYATATGELGIWGGKMFGQSSHPSRRKGADQ